MRALCFALGTLVAVVAWADPGLVGEIPNAHKVLKRTLRLHGASSLNLRDRREFAVQAPIGEAWETALTYDERGRRASVDLAYQFLIPFPDAIPGISIGVVDLPNRTRDGRSLYLVATWQFGLQGESNGNVPAELTLGGGTGRYRGLLFGMKLPLTDRFSLTSQHDSRDLRAGFEFQATQELKFRIQFQQNRSLVSFDWTLR
ncbi:MAG: hypothetical protein JNM85_06900 [Chthonomonas sp.]|nr:hypothetical protein [Chthonomonas sp.]